MDSASDPLLRQQVTYYRARASEYDEWFLRQGRYDRGPEVNRRWFAEAEQVFGALEAFRPEGRVLELACGTGLWTARLLRHAGSLTAVDASPEMLALCRARVGDDTVRFVQADVFSWQPDTVYDVVFFSFWLSHVPWERFESFWKTVRSCLAPRGHVFFVDSLYDASSTAVDHHLDGPETTTALRCLNDGREFSIVKVFHRPAHLAVRLGAMGWHATVTGTAHFFLYGWGSPRNEMTS